MKNHRQKRLTFRLSAAFIAVISALSMTVSAFALVIDPDQNGSLLRYIGSGYNQMDVTDLTEDMDGFRKYLFEAFYNCGKGTGSVSVDISKFRIPSEKDDCLINFLCYDFPEIFNISTVEKTKDASGKYFSTLTVSGTMPVSEYHSQLAECIKVAEELTDDIRRSTQLTQAQKALLIHDRLAVLSEYVSGETGSSTMYSVLVNHRANCTGYMKAYNFLLRMVGIESYSVLLNYTERNDLSGQEKTHSWNVVIIDGEKYNVDVTFDDKTGDDLLGRVSHSYFLVSTDKLKAIHRQVGHIADDDDYHYDPVSKKYDDAFWNGSETEFILHNSCIYYFDNTEKYLVKWDGNTRTNLFSVSDKWYNSNQTSSRWANNYTRLAYDGKYILYSLPKKIYRYDTSTGVKKVILEPDSIKNNTQFIFGFTFRSGNIMYDIGGKSDVVMDVRCISASYLPNMPESQIKISNGNITFDFKLLQGFTGYYWGKNPDYSKNTYTYGLFETKTVAEPGTYYYAVRDIMGNVSKTRCFTFCKTAFQHDSVTNTVITLKGSELVLPEYEKSDSIFEGWVDTGLNSGRPLKTVCTYENKSYTAHWTGITVSIRLYEWLEDNEVGKEIMPAPDGEFHVENETFYFVDTDYSDKTDTVIWTSSDEDMLDVTRANRNDGIGYRRIYIQENGETELSAEIAYKGSTYGGSCIITTASDSISEKIGDINADGKINVVDSYFLKQIIVGTVVPTADQFRFADINEDGKINAVDGNLMKQLILGG